MPTHMSKLDGFAVFAPLYVPAVLGGGPIRTLKALVDSAPQNVALHVLASDRDLGMSTPLPVVSDAWSERAGVPIYYCSPTIRASFRGLLSIRKTRPRVVYFNSFFAPRFSLLPQILGRLGFWRGAQVLIAPRGEFSQGALSIRAVKKQFALTIYKGLGLHRRVIWHASSLAEASDIRSVFGLRCRILVREDETSLPLVASHQSRVAHPKLCSLQIVFISRLSPMKGLDILLESLMLTSVNVILEIYGNAEDKEYVRHCRGLIDRLPSNVICNLNGAVSPELVRQMFAEGDVFVFPTAGENFGHVIAEALSVSCPIICSDLTSWSDVLRRAGGDVIDSRDPRDWKHAIESFAALSVEQVAKRRQSAGAAYNAWSAADKGDHIFSLVLKLLDE